MGSALMPDTRHTVMGLQRQGKDRHQCHMDATHDRLAAPRGPWFSARLMQLK